MRLPRWLYWSHEAAGVLRTTAYGSRRTGLHLLTVASLAGGPTVYMLALRGWMLTFGPEVAVEEGLHDVREACPDVRWRTWRTRAGRAFQLSYVPAPTEDVDR